MGEKSTGDPIRPTLRPVRRVRIEQSIARPGDWQLAKLDDTVTAPTDARFSHASTRRPLPPVTGRVDPEAAANGCGISVGRLRQVPVVRPSSPRAAWHDRTSETDD